MVDYVNYTRLGRRRGFRLNCARFSVHRLSVRIFSLFRRCFRLLRKGSRGRGVRRQARDYKSTRACMRSNSFYAEAIADCLEFIKRNSVSLDDCNDAVGITER